MRRFSTITLLTTLNAVLGISISAFNFHDINGQPFSMLNHFVSELGDPRFSSTAWVFNLSFATLDLLLMIWFFKVLTTTSFRYKKLIVSLFVVTAVSVLSVGIFNRSIQPWHRVATALTFSGVGVFMITLTYELNTQNAFISRINRALTNFAALGYFGTMFIAAFFFNPAHQILVTDGFATRPDVWPIAMLEWGIFGFMVLWVISVDIGTKTVDLRQVHSEKLAHLRSRLPLR